MARKVLVMVSIMLVAVATVCAAEEATPAVKPITKVMLARLGWVQSMTKNIAYSNFEAVAKDAGELAGQAKKVGDASPAAFNKDRNLKISELSTAMAAAAGAKDGAAVTAKLGEVLATCYSCHTKLRDK